MSGNVRAIAANTGTFIRSDSALVTNALLGEARRLKLLAGGRQLSGPGHVFLRAQYRAEAARLIELADKLVKP